MPPLDHRASLFDLLRLELRIDTDRVHTGTPLSEVASDSLEWVELLMAVEDRFELSISQEQSQALRTVGDLLRLLSQPVAAQA
jgi:acyl carrier protein